MYYTILGLFLGGIIFYTYAKKIRADFKFTSYLPPSGFCIVLTGIMIGGSIGLGYGINEIMHGRHLVNKILSYVY